jgi:hypothetical protein
MKCRVFWDVAPCSHVEVDRCFRGAYCLNHQGDIALMIEAVRMREERNVYRVLVGKSERK